MLRSACAQGQRWRALRSFIRDLASIEGDPAIVRAILVMARSLKLSVVAEGVETPAPLAFLRAEGCDAVQGFLVSPPQGPGAATAFIGTFDPQTMGAAMPR